MSHLTAFHAALILFLSRVLLVTYAQYDYHQDDNCDNNPSFRYESQPMHQNISEIISDQVCKEGSYCHAEATRNGKFIFHIKGQKPGQDFIVCTTPKSGISRAKFMLMRIIDNSFPGTFTDALYGWRQYNPLGFMHTKQVQNLLNDPSIPRFLMVRDPYARALSMYNDKIASDKGPQYLPKLGHKDGTPVSFGRFVELLYEKKQQERLTNQGDGFLDIHFVSQTRHCRVNVGMTYNYMLKMEEIDNWWDCFIDKVNIREEMMHRWPGENNCYFSSSKSPCDGPVFNNGVVMKKDGSTTKHTHGSVNQLDEAYSNKTIRDMVTYVFQEDIINFNYPIRT